MDDAAKSRLLEAPVVDGMAGSSRVFNHRWESPETFATLGTIPAQEVSAATDGKLEIDIAVRLNQLVGDADANTPYDHILVCGPVFPHEVAGFSGGNKYFVPGVGRARGDRRHPLAGGPAHEPTDHRGGVRHRCAG